MTGDLFIGGGEKTVGWPLQTFKIVGKLVKRGGD